MNSLIFMTRFLSATTRFTNFEKIMILLSVELLRSPGTIGEGLSLFSTFDVASLINLTCCQEEPCLYQVQLLHLDV